MRGPEAQWPKLQALVPHHTGLTASASPPLFWWLESLPPAGTGLVFYLVDDSTGETRLRAPLQRPPAPGAQSVRLADRGIELRQGVEYEWSVALEREADGEQLAVATGWIERVDAPASAGPPTGVEAVERLARAGLWYDALASASDLIRAQPGDAAPRRARAGLLDQVGLSQASDR